MWLPHHTRLGKGVERGHMTCLPHLSRIITFNDTVELLSVFMDNSFTYTEENASESENSFGKGRVRGHMMWLTHHSRICPGKESARTHDVSAAPHPDLHRFSTRFVVGPGVVGPDPKAIGRVRL